MKYRNVCLARFINIEISESFHDDVGVNAAVVFVEEMKGIKNEFVKSGKSLAVLVRNVIFRIITKYKDPKVP